jgi:hypothetical protein
VLSVVVEPLETVVPELFLAEIVIVGAVLSITNALLAAKLVPMLKLLIALPAASDNDPADNAIDPTVRSLLVSPLCTV